MNRRLTWILGPLIVLTFPQLYLLHQHLIYRDSSKQGRYEHGTSSVVHMGDDSSDEQKTMRLSYVVVDTSVSKQKETLAKYPPREDSLASRYQSYVPGNIRSIATADVLENAFPLESSSGSQTTNKTFRRYLFPVQFWEGGPNWNYLSFRRMVAYAITHNRTIVMIPFHNHFIEGWNKGWRTFGETFDIGKLSELVPMVTPEAYKEDCGNTVDLLVQFPLSKMKENMKKFHRNQYERTRTDFQSLWGIELPDTRYNRRNKTELFSQMTAADDVRCLAIHGPLQIQDLHIENETDVLKLVDRYFFKAEYIRKMGDYVRSEICGGKPYVAIHWRNRTGEVCEFNLLLNGAERCSGDLMTLSNASRSTAGAVGHFMESRGIDCVYVAAPPRRQEFVDRLRDVVLHVFTASDITLIKDKRFRRLRKDNYKLSLVEQEVCEGAEVFLSCGRSNWSDFVRISRELKGKEVSYLRDIAGVPKEIYRLI